VRLFSLDYTVLIVEELDRSVAFYSEVLGISLSHQTSGYAQLITGQTRLALYTRESMSATLGQELEAPARNAPSSEIGFLVADVDEAYQVITERGAESVKEPTDRFWGQRTAYVRDPDGHLIELVQQLE